MFVTVLMPVRNEAAFISRSLTAVLAQDYPPDQMEVIVVDGMSADETREIVQSFGGQYPNVRVIDNAERIVSTGLNKAIEQAKGEILVRVDGHTEVAPDYVRQCVSELQRTGADNVGGKMAAIGHSLFGQAVALATSSPFGVGNARFHYSDQEEWVDTVYLGAWRRETFERVGLFDEELVRNQDDEFNYRLRKHGGRILLSPRLKSKYATRSTPASLWRQYFQYGYWKVRVMQKHPRLMRLRQFVPTVFVLALLATLLFAWLFPSGWIPFSLVAGSYALANLAVSIGLAYQRGWKYLAMLPAVYAILHLSYGMGFLVGLVKFRNRWGKQQNNAAALQNTDVVPTRIEASDSETSDIGLNDLNRLRAEYAACERRLANNGFYSPFNPARLFELQQRQRAVLKLLRRHGFNPLGNRCILELGCGRGEVLLEYLGYGAAPKHLHGVDLIFPRVKDVSARLPHLPLTCADGQHLPYGNHVFDLVLQYTVFSSILGNDVKVNLAREMLRVLKPGGMILWYDFWLNPTNKQTRGIRPAEIGRLFPGCHVEFQRLTLAPPIARRLIPVSWWLCELLEKVKVFNTHYLVAIYHPNEADSQPWRNK